MNPELLPEEKLYQRKCHATSYASNNGLNHAASSMQSCGIQSRKGRKFWQQDFVLVLLAHQP
jgi:hypothetical protein